MRLRSWLGVDEARFYDAKRIALLPMGFCFPGSGRGGDLPPRRECADRWRARLLAELPNVQLTLLLGRYAVAWHLPELSGTLTEAVSRWRDYAPRLFLAPHPSPRNQRWLRNNAWFEAEVVPALRVAVAEALS